MRKIRTYIEEVVSELFEKVSWPTWSELQNSSFVVLIASTIVSLLVWLMDFTFGINPGVWKGVLGFIYNLIAQQMKWYIVRTVTGKEKKSKEYLDIEIERLKMSSYIAEVLVPTERVIQIRKGKKIIKEKNMKKNLQGIEVIF